MKWDEVNWDRWLAGVIKAGKENGNYYKIRRRFLWFPRTLPYSPGGELVTRWLVTATWREHLTIDMLYEYHNVAVCWEQ